VDPAIPRVFSDTNARLMNLYAQLRISPAAVRSALPPAEGVTPELFAEVKAEFNQAGPGPRMAALLLWLSRAGFNGLYRENENGEYNVAYGKRESVLTPDLEPVSAVLQNAAILSGDFEATMALAGPGWTVYADPPYFGTWSGYSEGGFGTRDHLRLRAAALEAKGRGARVFISGSDVSIYRFNIVWTGSVGRTISVDGATRGRAVEHLVQA